LTPIPCQKKSQSLLRQVMELLANCMDCRALLRAIRELEKRVGALEQDA